MKNVDMGSLMKNFDLGSITGLLKNIDIGSLMKTAGPMMAAMKGLNLGPVADIMSTIAPMTDMLRGFDIKSAIDMVKEKPIDLERLINLKDAAWDFLEQKGVPMDDPVAFVNFVHQKVKDLHLPADLDLTPIFNVLHGQLEAMGMPEDKTKIKQWLMDMAGLSGIKDIEELKDPEVLTQVAIKKAFRMMGLDENSDPQQVVDRVHEQLIDEAKKVGASINKDASPEDVMKEMDKVLTKRLNDVFGMDAESAMPDELHRALTNKLQEHGFPVHDFGAMKKHVMDIVMKELVKTVTPMIMNLFMGGSAQPPHPPMMPPMLPPHIPINLAVSVNVEGPAAPQIVQMPVPRYLHGAEPALEHEDLDDMDDQSVYEHIMVVRQALMSGEMPEEILQEMIEDLMNARLKSRVLAVRNMFLADRLAAMEHEMDAMNMQMSRMRMQPRLAAPSRQMVPRRQAPRRNAESPSESPESPFSVTILA
ncbi:hypothetical protein DPMN_015403 [Dreissena polymorpha]|uniref:Uncharacterized protein n=2 Tax=Dreissena polymorpha TaxID=45954 RepID=A0A9D4NCK8_DREPO|nr:hypothetical protein DPMN_015403 [Dreissena polymorpha]